MIFFLLVVYALIILWLGSKIMEKAGLKKWNVLFLLIPVINIIMIWMFAFQHWSNLKDDVKQDFFG